MGIVGNDDALVGTAVGVFVGTVMGVDVGVDDVGTGTLVGASE